MSWCCLWKTPSHILSFFRIMRRTRRHYVKLLKILVALLRQRDTCARYPLNIFGRFPSAEKHICIVFARHSSLEEDSVTHFVVLPASQEDEGMLQETLESLSSSPLAEKHVRIVLARKGPREVSPPQDYSRLDHDQNDLGGKSCIFSGVGAWRMSSASSVDWPSFARKTPSHTLSSFTSYQEDEVPSDSVECDWRCGPAQELHRGVRLPPRGPSSRPQPRRHLPVHRLV